MAGRSREGYCQPRVEGSMQGARGELEDQLKEARLDGLREPRAEGLREARHRRIEQSPLAMSVHFKFPLAPIAHAAPPHLSAKQSLLQRVLDGPARSSLVSAGVDAVQLAHTAALHHHFVSLSEAAASRMPEQPSQCERRRIHQEASALCRQFNQIAMSCLEVNSPPRTVKLARAVAHECLQRALRLVPARADKLLAATLCNTGLLYLQRRKPTHATRFLRRAIALDADPVTNARSKLNLSSALAQLKELDEALRHAQSAFDLLQEAAAGQAEREGEDEDGTGAGGPVETDSAVLSVLALRSITICHEALGNHSQALSNVRMALKMGETVLPGGSPLMSQLTQYEQDLANRKSRPHTLSTTRNRSIPLTVEATAPTSRNRSVHLPGEATAPPIRSRSTPLPVDATVPTARSRSTPPPVDATVPTARLRSTPPPVEASAPAARDRSTPPPVEASAPAARDRSMPPLVEASGSTARSRAMPPPPEVTVQSSKSRKSVALPRLDELSRPVRLKSRESDKAEPSDALPKAVMSKAEMEALYVRLQQTGRVSHSEDRSRGERSPVSPARLKAANTTTRPDAERSGKSRARDRPLRPDLHTHEDARTSDDVDDLGLISSDLKPEQMIRLIRIQRKIRARVARKYAMEEKKIARNAGDALSRLATWVRSRHVLLPGMAATGGRSCKAKGEDSETGSGVDSEASELTGPEPSMLNAVRSFTRIHEKDSAVSPAKKLIASLEKRVRRPLPLCMQRGYFAMGGRTLRIFLSSTFRDMNGEREILLKKYAPALRQMGRERGVFISFVDLRWGVTKEQAQGGEVVDICLSELGRSHYFVNFLGLRGGWRPTKAQVTKPTFNKFPFLTSYCPGRSVTEFEVLYGALGWGPKSVVHPRSAFFYMRDDAYVEKLPKEERVHFKEQDKEGIKRLADLKHRIRKRAAESEKHNGRALNRSTLPYVECLREYENPSDFAELVYQDLQKAIERDYPPRPMMSHLDAIMWRHVAYAKAQVHAYIVSETVVSAVSSYVDGVQQSADGIRRPLIIDGVRGSGKTAALAHWFLNNTRSGFVLPHFIGCNADSTDHVLCLRRMLLELQRSFNLDSEEFNKRGLPNDQEAIASLLPVWLARAAMEGPIVIIIDGLDQLRDADGVSLGWLPATLPSNCSLILSANRIGAIDSALTRRGWGSPSCTVPPLSEKEREALATKYLRLVNKTLEPHQLIMLSRHKNCSTPLFIRMTCDEMIASAVFETIEEVIAYCTSKPDCLALSEVMLERFEHQFERVMVERAFCYLLVSRNGLEAQELIKLLGCSQTAWSTFYFAAGEALHEDSGQLTIGAHVLRAAVAKRYLKAASKKALVHMDLVSFFQQADDVIEQRRMQELPFHMLQTGQVEPLRALLLDLTRIRHLLPHRDGRHDLEVYWDAVGGGKPPPGLGETYLRVLEEQREQLKTDIAQENTAHDMSKRAEVRATDAREASIANLAGLVGVFLAELKQYDGAELLQRIAFDIERSVRDSMSMEVAARARDLARTLCLQGKFQAASDKLYLALGAYHSIGKTEPAAQIESAETLLELAQAAQFSSDPSVARIKCQSALRTFQKLLGPSHTKVAHVLNKLAVLCMEAGSKEDLDQAIEYAEQARSIFEERGGTVRAQNSNTAVTDCLHVRGCIHLRSDEAADAVRLLSKALGMVLMTEGGRSLASVNVLEDLALAKIKLQPPREDDSRQLPLDRSRPPTKKTSSRTLSRTLGSQSSLSNLREGVPSPKNKKRSKVLGSASEATSSNGEHGSSALSRENSKVLGFNAQEEGSQTLPIVTESANGNDVMSGQNNDGLGFKARAEGSLRVPIMEESMNGVLSREDSEGLEFKGQGVGPGKPLPVAESSKRVSKTLSFSDDWKSKATDDLRQQVGEARETDAEGSLQRMESSDAKHTEGSDEEERARPSHLLKRLMHSRKQLSHLDVVSEDEKAVIEDIAATSAKEMLAQALKFRKEMQGEMHVQVGYCLVKIADAHWADWEFAEVLSTYKTAIPIFASVFGTEACAPVVQIYSGCALACTAVGDFEQALMWNQKALDIVDAVCSPTSWERYRALVDHARMLEFSVKQELQLSKTNDARVTSSRAFAKAERIEHHAATLYKELVAGNVQDTIDGRAPNISLQIPLHRARLIPDPRLNPSAPRVRSRQSGLIMD